MSVGNKSNKHLVQTMVSAQPNLDGSVRKRIISELASSEMTYGQTLVTLKEVFMDPLHSRGVNILTDDEKAFLNLDVLDYLIKLNETVLGIVMPVVDNWSDDSSLGTVFQDEFFFCLRMYKPFVISYKNRMDRVAMLRIKNERFAKFLEESEMDHRCDGQKFDSMLTEPVQRVMRYKLFVERNLKVLKEQPPGHMDIPLSQGAMERLVSFEREINDACWEIESKEAARIIRCRMPKNVQAIAGLYQLYRGLVTVESKKGPAESREIFLFSQCLVICKPVSDSKSSISVKQYFPLQTLVKVSASLGVKDVRVSLLGTSSNSAFEMNFSNISSAEEFMSKVNKAIEKIR